MDDRTRERRKTMREHVKADLARRGLGNTDLEGVDFDTHVDTGLEVPIVGWTMTVRLTGDRPPLAYSMDNAAGAAVHCNGELLTAPTVH